jgi:hypothetical protein
MAALVPASAGHTRKVPLASEKRHRVELLFAIETCDVHSLLLARKLRNAQPELARRDGSAL